MGENFYLHTQSKLPKQLSRLRGVSIESISWNPSQPTASTREILIGATDGNIYETYIDSSTDFLRREEKYLKAVYKIDGPASAIWTDLIPGKPELRRILVASPKRLLHFFGHLGRHGHEGSSSIFARLFETQAPVVRDVHIRPSSAVLAVTPEPPDMSVLDDSRPERIFAWLSSDGVLHGRLLTSPADPELGNLIFSEARKLEASQVTSDTKENSTNSNPSFIALTQWHILQLVDNRIVAVNRLDGSTVFDQVVLDAGQRPLSLLADLKKNTFWFFTSKDIYEIVVRDEDRDIWKVMLKAERFEAALQYASSAAQKDIVATAYGDSLIREGKFEEGAAIHGTSSKPFEQVALDFVAKGETDALRKYLQTKLATMKKKAVMQRILLTSWLTEIFMSKLNALDDMVSTKAELAENQTTEDAQRLRGSVRAEFQDFIHKYKSDLDRKTVYDIISSHGRERELLFFSTAIGDNNYVLAYWVQRENWQEALKALNRQTDPEITYRYSSVLMAKTASQFIDIVMRQTNLEPRKLIPALLNYNQVNDVPLPQNQAVKYLRFQVDQNGSRDSAVHNSLISIYASHTTRDESALLAYLQSQTPVDTTAYPTSIRSPVDQLPYDADFALRLCIQHSRIRSSCLIYTTMGQHSAAVTLALDHDHPDLAISIAEQPEHSPAASKKLWLTIARSFIQSPSSATIAAISPSRFTKSSLPPPGPKGLEPRKGQNVELQQISITAALSLLQRAPPGVLRMEDLLPLLPDFVLIDAFKDEICTALESYSSSIDALRLDMDASVEASARIKSDMEKTKDRWVLVEPGDACVVCSEVLLERRFWVWSCGHGVHADCAVKDVEARGRRSDTSRIKELRGLLSQERRREEAQKQLDDIVGKECTACGVRAVCGIDEPLVRPEESIRNWRL